MSSEIFASLLLTISVLTSLATEALKKVFNLSNNVIAAITTTAITLFSCVFYATANNCAVDFQYIMTCIALWAMSWLSAMLGYDKIIQTISQIGVK